MLFLRQYTDTAMPARTVFPLMLIRTAGLPSAWLDLLQSDWQAHEAALDAARASHAAARAALQTAFNVAFQALPESPLRTAVYNARRDFFQRQKLPAGKIEGLELTHDHLLEMQALRLAVEVLATAEQTLQEAGDAYRAHYQAVLESGWENLQRLAREPEFQRALLFASHTLLAQLPAFDQTPVSGFAKKERQTAASLAQYLTRAAAKTTPFSRFTTVSVQRWEEQAPDLFFPETKAAVTPNVALLPALYDVLLDEPVFYRALSVGLNPCITETQSDTYTWIYFDGTHESFQQMPASPAVRFVVEVLLAQQRQLPFPALLSSFAESADATREASERFLLDLLDVGLLEWKLPERGLSPGWCGGLYQFLGFLPGEPAIVDTAALLQWLRTTARTLPFQPVEAAREAQTAALQAVQRFFEKYGRPVPAIPVEQLFYEDVERPARANVPPEVIRSLADALADCWLAQKRQVTPQAKAQMLYFAQAEWPDADAVDFMVFCKKLLQNDTLGAVMTTVETSPARRKIGVLMQVFQEAGAWKAVINGLFPGGGKLFARWLHLFPADFTHKLRDWHAESAALAFPWQGWDNANFQPESGTKQLAVPGARMAGAEAVLLGNVALRATAFQLELIDKRSGAAFELTDLGLEAPDSRPPAMRTLWHLGVPNVSLESLLPMETVGWQSKGQGWRFRPRIEQGPLVLRRALWEVSAGFGVSWLRDDEQDSFQAMRAGLKEMGVPSRFFARRRREKPQYFDQDSPVLMLLLAKTLRTASPVYFSEMLPLPEQALVENDGPRVAEFVLELE